MSRRCSNAPWLSPSAVLATNPVDVVLCSSSRSETRHRVNVDFLIESRSKNLQSRFACPAILRSDALSDELKFVALLVPILRERALAAQDVVNVHPSPTIARNRVSSFGRFDGVGSSPVLLMYRISRCSEWGIQMLCTLCTANRENLCLWSACYDFQVYSLRQSVGHTRASHTASSPGWGITERFAPPNESSNYAVVLLHFWLRWDSCVGQADQRGALLLLPCQPSWRDSQRSCTC